MYTLAFSTIHDVPQRQGKRSGCLQRLKRPMPLGVAGIAATRPATTFVTKSAATQMNYCLVRTSLPVFIYIISHSHPPLHFKVGLLAYTQHPEGHRKKRNRYILSREVTRSKR